MRAPFVVPVLALLVVALPVLAEPRARATRDADDRLRIELSGVPDVPASSIVLAIDHARWVLPEDVTPFEATDHRVAVVVVMQISQPWIDREDFAIATLFAKQLRQFHPPPGSTLAVVTYASTAALHLPATPFARLPALPFGTQADHRGQTGNADGRVHALQLEIGGAKVPPAAPARCAALTTLHAVAPRRRQRRPARTRRARPPAGPLTSRTLALEGCTRGARQPSSRRRLRRDAGSARAPSAAMQRTILLCCLAACSVSNDVPRLSLDEAPVLVLGETFLGCFEQGTTRALPTLLAQGGQTPDSCRALARASGHPFFALENGGDCYAGATYGFAKVGSERCATPCTAAPWERCGGRYLEPQVGEIVVASTYVTVPLAENQCTVPGDPLRECMSQQCASLTVRRDGYGWSGCADSIGLAAARQMAFNETDRICREKHGGPCACIQYSPPGQLSSNDCRRVIGVPWMPGATVTSVRGYVDAVVAEGASVYVSGWACRAGNPQSITVRVSAGGALVATATANLASEPAVAAACQSTGSAYRYRIAIPDPGAYAGQPVRVEGLELNGTGTSLTGSGAFTVPSVATAVCGNGVCESGEAGWSCGTDCCDASTSCWSTRGNAGSEYCRSMNGGAYQWLTPAAANTYCDDGWEVGSSTYACGGASGTCCALVGGWVGGSCGG